MKNAAQKPWVTALAIAFASFAFLCLPVALVGCALVENALFSTSYLDRVAYETGTHGAFEKLYEALKPILGW